VSQSATARLFVAVELPAPVRLTLAHWGRTAAGVARASGGELRAVDESMLHLTMCFLGGRPIGEIAAVKDALSAIEPRALGEISLGAPLWLPPRRARVLAIEVHDDSQRTLQALHREVRGALTAACELPSERRRFRPHVTVARMRSTGAPRERRLPATPLLSFTPKTFVLYRSWLSPAGGSYEPLQEIALD
jgi:2'-5' RNA ligase